MEITMKMFVAAFVAFVAGTGASYAYGQNFMVDGGYR
jgi:1,4-dihydroxy-2-naphthoate octaprenyltransferase